LMMNLPNSEVVIGAGTTPRSASLAFIPRSARAVRLETYCSAK
jgi:hypothetical protein